MKRVVDKLRWWLATQLNRLPGQCWAELVGWAMGDRRSPWCPIDRVCRDDQARTGFCYCGKLRPEENS